MNTYPRAFILFVVLTSNFVIDAMMRNRVGAPPTSSFSPLHYAVARGHVAIVQSILESGTNPDAIINFGVTPLHLAVILNKLTAFKLLIDAGADVNAVNRFGETPLHFAAGALNAEMVQLLLAAGADRTRARHRGANREAPLELALRAYRGHPQTNEYKRVIYLLRNWPIV